MADCITQVFLRLVGLKGVGGESLPTSKIKFEDPPAATESLPN